MVLKELCALRGVSGNEHEVRDFLLEKVRKTADEVRVDRMGNVLALKKADRADAPTILLDAHMDEVGMIVVGVNDNGLLSYDTVGGIDSRVVVSKHVRVGEKAVPGVIGAKAIHLQTAAERETVLGHSDLYIDIGAKDKAQAEELVQPGDYVSFDSDYVEFGDGYVKARALDDRVGCMTLLRILENRYDVNVVCAFTCQEEIGLNGALAARFGVGMRRGRGHGRHLRQRSGLRGRPSEGVQPEKGRGGFLYGQFRPARPAAVCTDAGNRPGSGHSLPGEEPGGRRQRRGAHPLFPGGRGHRGAQRALPKHPFALQRGGV